MSVFINERLRSDSSAVIIANEVQIEPGVHKLLANKFRPMSGWNGRIGSQPFVYEYTH